MSMSEFERNAQDPEDDLSTLSAPREKFPDDFSVDDVVFAHELDGFFDIDQEEIPPYFTQTLLEADDQRFQAAEHAFEQKTCVNVFRRLKMRRRLFRPDVAPFQKVKRLPTRRTFLSGLTVMVVVMALSIVYTAPSFASGLALLLAGPHSGVIQVHKLPQNTKMHYKGDISPSPSSGNYIGIVEAQKLLHFSMYFPQDEVLPGSYTTRDIYLYDGADQNWVDGPIMELDYSNLSPGVVPHSNSHFVICEFKPIGKVLQLVGYGSAHTLEIDPRGKASGIYVDGYWTEDTHEWNYGNRSELIYEHDGIVFWIIGYQRDGMDGNALRKIAASLQTYDIKDVRTIRNIKQLPDDTPPLLQGQVIYMDNTGNINAPTLKRVGDDSDQTTNGNSHIPKGMHVI